MDHLRRNLQRALARDEDDPAPIRTLHRRQIGAGEAHPAHDVDLEEAHPIRIRDRLERLRLSHAQVVDQNVDFGMAADQVLDRLSRSEIPGEAEQFAAGFGLERRNRLFDGRRGPAVDDHARALPGEARRDRRADSSGAARHQRPFAFELEVHALSQRTSTKCDRRICVKVRHPGKTEQNEENGLHFFGLARASATDRGPRWPRTSPNHGFVGDANPWRRPASEEIKT